MRIVLEIAVLILAALAMAPALAHALEWPGKHRLDRETYYAVQKIYYPGFTIAGVAEPAAFLATLALLLFGEQEDSAGWLTFAALLCLALMQLVYWRITHPVNTTWIEGERMGNLGTGFFSVATKRGGEPRRVEWTALRDRWESSHMARAALSFVAFAALAVAVAVD